MPKSPSIEPPEMDNQKAMEAMFGNMPGGEAFAKIAKSDFLNKAIDLLTSETNPQLDNVRKAIEKELATIKGQLEDLKKGVEASPELENLAINILPKMWENVKKSLEKDCFEAGIDDDKKIEEITAHVKTKWEQAVMDLIQNAVSENPQNDKLTNFITDISTYPALAAAMSTAKPQLKIISFLEEKLGLLPPNIQKLFGGKKEMKNRAILTLAGMGMLPPAVSNALKAYVKQSQESPSQTPEQPRVAQAAPEMSDEQKAAVDKLKSAGFEMDMAKTEEDINFLKSQNVNIDELLTKATAENSNLNKIRTEISAHVGDKQVKFRLIDAYTFDADQLEPGQIEKIASNVKNLKKDPATIRTFLNNAGKVRKGETEERMIAVLELERLSATT